MLMVRIWCKHHESMDPSCLVSTVQAGGGNNGVGAFSWHTLGPLIPIEHCLNATSYLMHPFMLTVCPQADVNTLNKPLFPILFTYTFDLNACT
uniref:Uncharacterized protein n=1 Tax=Leptobrachium leishanense TaxID=445787 RepID=A0A8C5R5Y0_9ANUR